MTTTKTVRTITVNAPVKICFDLACDAIKMNTLQPIKVTIADHSGGLTDVGTTFNEISTIMGIKIISKYTATDVVPNKRIVFDVRSNSNVNTAMSWDFATKGDSTVIEFCSEAKSENFFAGILMHLSKRSFDNIVHRFLNNYVAEAERIANLK